MNGDRVVEVGFGSTHVHRDGEALDNFICTATNDVTANDLLIRSSGYQFDDGWWFSRCHRMVHVGEPILINLDIWFTKRADCFVLC